MSAAGHSAYRREGASTLIEVELRDPRQLFHTLDPSPFRERDLDAQAEAYLLEAARELHLASDARLVIHLPAEVMARDETRSIPEAVRHYFDYRAEECDRQLRKLLRAGAVSLGIGLLFLLGCLSARRLLMPLPDGDLEQILGEGLLIIGWVALWRPLEIFLYDWWPVWRHGRELRWLASRPVELRPGIRVSGSQA
ncbi:MAG: hypothetical protein RLZZ200_2109 [Pseudomonadota bacterium]|jgi:hypothetical protein